MTKNMGIPILLLDPNEKVICRISNSGESPKPPRKKRKEFSWTLMQWHYPAARLGYKLFLAADFENKNFDCKKTRP